MGVLANLLGRATRTPTVQRGLYPAPLTVMRAQMWATHPVTRAEVASIDVNNLARLAAQGYDAGRKPMLSGFGVSNRYAGDLGPLQNFARGPFVGFNYRTVRPGFMRGLPVTWANPAASSTTVAAIRQGLGT